MQQEGLKDASSPQVYWAAEQARWTEVFTQRLSEIRARISSDEGGTNTKQT